jgi:hypothetical protein
MMVPTAERWPALGGEFRTCTDRIIARSHSSTDGRKFHVTLHEMQKNNMTFASMSEALTVESVESQAIYLIISVVQVQSGSKARAWVGSERGQGLKIFPLPLGKGFYMNPTIFRNLY